MPRLIPASIVPFQPARDTTEQLLQDFYTVTCLLSALLERENIWLESNASPRFAEERLLQERIQMTDMYAALAARVSRTVQTPESARYPIVAPLMGCMKKLRALTLLNRELLLQSIAEREQLIERIVALACESEGAPHWKMFLYQDEARPTCH
jgi:hypothetical protein